MRTSPSYSDHIRDQSEHGTEIKGGSIRAGCNHPDRILASPAGAEWAAAGHWGEAEHVLDQGFVAPLGCKLDTSCSLPALQELPI